MNELEGIAEFLVEKKHAVALTGAGISTPSGIPDFRSEDGLWSKYEPKVYANYSIFLEEPEHYWNMARETTPLILHAKPNIIHNILAKMEEMGIIDAIITQNVDFLHQKAGSKKIYELHGTYRTVTCLECARQILRSEIEEFLKTDNGVPICTDCGGILAPDVILFGQELDPEVMEQARREVTQSNALIVIGSSLTVGN